MFPKTRSADIKRILIQTLCYTKLKIRKKGDRVTAEMQQWLKKCVQSRENKLKLGTVNCFRQNATPL